MYTQNNEFILNALLECIVLTDTHWDCFIREYPSDIKSTFNHNSMFALLLQELGLLQYNFIDCVQL